MAHTGDPTRHLRLGYVVWALIALPPVAELAVLALRIGQGAPVAGGAGFRGVSAEMIYYVGTESWVYLLAVAALALLGFVELREGTNHCQYLGRNRSDYGDVLPAPRWPAEEMTGRVAPALVRFYKRVVLAPAVGGAALAGLVHLPGAAGNVLAVMNGLAMSAVVAVIAGTIKVHFSARLLAAEASRMRRAELDM